MTWSMAKIQQARKYQHSGWAMKAIAQELHESVDDVALALYGQPKDLLARPELRKLDEKQVVVTITSKRPLTKDENAKLMKLVEFAARQFVEQIELENQEAQAIEAIEAIGNDVSHLTGKVADVPDVAAEPEPQSPTKPDVAADAPAQSEGVPDGHPEQREPERQHGPVEPEPGGPAEGVDSRAGDVPYQPEDHDGPGVRGDGRDADEPAAAADRPGEGGHGEVQAAGPGTARRAQQDRQQPRVRLREDEPRGSDHVDLQGHHLVADYPEPAVPYAPAVTPLERPAQGHTDPPRSGAATRKDAAPAAPAPAAPPAGAKFHLQRASGDYLDKSGIGFTDRIDRAYRGTEAMIETVLAMKPYLRECKRVPAQ